MENVKLTINGKEITAPAGSTILEAARQNGIYIPTLCYDEAVEAVSYTHLLLLIFQDDLQYQHSLHIRFFLAKRGLIPNNPLPIRLLPCLLYTSSLRQSFLN